MRKIHLLALLAVLAVTPAHAKEPSEACSNGEIPPSTTPADVGVRQAGDPYQEPTSVYLCSRSHAPGSVWIRVDNTNGRVHVISDGDSPNRTTRCSDGYTAVRADQDGSVRIYRGDHGDYSFSAKEKTVADWINGATACAAQSRAVSRRARTTQQ